MTFDRNTLHKLYQYCLTLARDKEQAEDLLHSALERFLKKKYEKIDYPETYIRRIARNLYFDQLRRQKVIQMETIPDTNELSEIEKNLETIMTDKLTVERIWKELSSAEREVIYLWAVEEMSASEIADTLGEPRSTILSRLYRMRNRIKDHFATKKPGEKYG